MLSFPDRPATSVTGFGGVISYGDVRPWWALHRAMLVVEEDLKRRVAQGAQIDPRMVPRLRRRGMRQYATDRPGAGYTTASIMARWQGADLEQMHALLRELLFVVEL
jgi:hypothetical protein